MSLVCGAAEYIVRVPDGIWVAVTGSVIGASLTLLGVGLSNWNSRKQLVMQLEADEIRQAESHRMQTREKVYMATASWAAGALIGLKKFVNLDIEAKPESSEDAELMAAPSKLQVIANEDTFTALSNFGDLYIDAQTTLTLLRQQALNARKKFLESEALIEGEHEFAHRGRRTLLVTEYESAYRKVVATTLDRTDALNELEARLSIAMRKELGFKIDEAAFLRASAKSSAHQRKLVEEWFERALN